jgi:RhtB (resistance to homoserine/threonine) family protein
MIEPQAFWIFVGAVVILVLAPGPDMAYMLTRTIAQGRKAGVVAAVGINVGAYVHVLAAILGLSAILVTSSVAFTIVKWAGACYLVWIGIQALRTSASMAPPAGEATRLDLRTIFWQGFLSDVLNPKVALFFLAFLPQFVDYGSGSEIRQLLVLGVTGNVIAVAMNLVLVYFASAVTARLRRDQRVTRWLQRAMGAMFIALGIRLANEKL